MEYIGAFAWAIVIGVTVYFQQYEFLLGIITGAALMVFSAYCLSKVNL